ncbi:MAG: GNAT family N-acetyltransferase [Pyrinomonadaceae bacterium]|nr:GNAT family N-acetyltransferase [Pyrinomonadaceae bacterium]
MIETERLIISKLTPDDLTWLVEMRSPDAVNRYLGGPTMQNLEALTTRLQFYIDSYEKLGFGFCKMQLKSTGEAIGTSGLVPLDDTGEIEVGYNLSERYWRQGYGYECAMAWLKYGFEVAGLDRIVAVAHPDNKGSWRIMEKCGMRYEKSGFHYNMDVVYYAITRDEFLAPKRDDIVVKLM